MKELFEDVKGKLLGDPRLSYVKRAGGVIVIRDILDWPLSTNPPGIALVDAGTPEVNHLSSRKRWQGFSLEVHVIQQIMNREKMFLGDKDAVSIEQMAKDVRFVLDMERFGGKYLRAFLRTESSVNLLAEGNVHLQEKALTFEYVRIE